jgi:hypothetical protein
VRATLKKVGVGLAILAALPFTFIVAVLLAQIAPCTLFIPLVIVVAYLIGTLVMDTPSRR